MLHGQSQASCPWAWLWGFVAGLFLHLHACAWLSKAARLNWPLSDNDPCAQGYIPALGQCYLPGCFWVTRVPCCLFIQLRGCSTSVGDRLVGRSSPAGSEPITLAAPGTGDVISRSRAPTSIIPVGFHGNRSFGCCLHASLLLPAGLLFMTSARTCVPLPSTFPTAAPLWKHQRFLLPEHVPVATRELVGEEGSSKSTASISIWLEFLLNFPVHVLAMPLCFNSLKEWLSWKFVVWKRLYLQCLVLLVLFAVEEPQNHISSAAADTIRCCSASENWQLLLLSHPA